MELGTKTLSDTQDHFLKNIHDEVIFEMKLQKYIKEKRMEQRLLITLYYLNIYKKYRVPIDSDFIQRHGTLSRYFVTPKGIFNEIYKNSYTIKIEFRGFSFSMRAGEIQTIEFYIESILYEVDKQKSKMMDKDRTIDTLQKQLAIIQQRYQQQSQQMHLLREVLQVTHTMFAKNYIQSDCLKKSKNVYQVYQWASQKEINYFQVSGPKKQCLRKIAKTRNWCGFALKLPVNYGDIYQLKFEILQTKSFNIKVGIAPQDKQTPINAQQAYFFDLLKWQINNSDSISQSKRQQLNGSVFQLTMDVSKLSFQCFLDTPSKKKSQKQPLHKKLTEFSIPKLNIKNCHYDLIIWLADKGDALRIVDDCFKFEEDQV